MVFDAGEICRWTVSISRQIILISLPAQLAYIIVKGMSIVLCELLDVSWSIHHDACEITPLVVAITRGTVFRMYGEKFELVARSPTA